MQNKTFLFFIGTTAELIKLAPVIKELKKRKVDFKIITSGQTEILFKEFSSYLGHVKVDISFKKKGNKSSVIIFILWAIKTFFVGLLRLRKEFAGFKKGKSYFIVHGDTMSSLIGAITAKVYGLNVVHIESGLRSFNFLEPFPEEISRYIISTLSDVHFSPNRWSLNNLRGKRGVKVNTYQNTLIESFWMAMRTKKKYNITKSVRDRYFILVIHRQEHVIFRRGWSREMIEFILKNSNKNLKCVLMNYELTSSFLKTIDRDLYNQIKKRVVLMPRLPYFDFIKLMSGAEYVVTDGGSNQEELYYLGKPCLVLRNHTERIEGLGENVVLSRGNKKLIKNFLDNYKKYKRKMVKPNKIVPSKIIANFLAS